MALTIIDEKSWSLSIENDNSAGTYTLQGTHIIFQYNRGGGDAMIRAADIVSNTLAITGDSMLNGLKLTKR
jgi:hypothetical protein